VFESRLPARSRARTTKEKTLSAGSGGVANVFAPWRVVYVAVEKSSPPDVVA